MSARKMPLVAAAVLAATCLPVSTTRAWGPQGHVIVARIAQLNLSDKANNALNDLLPDTDFSGSTSISDTKLASFADFVRHNSMFPQYTQSAPWHFVDIPVKPKTAFDPEQHCKEGRCALAKIDDFKTVLADKSMPKVRRQEALVFLVHLIGDLHQPLHCATRGDSGGNGLKVKYLGHSGHHLNLHSVWDDNLVRENLVALDPKKTAEKLNESIKDADRLAWSKTTPKDWMMESYELARIRAYVQGDGDTSLPSTGEPNLDEAYVKINKKAVASQLKKGGIRLAKLLNDALVP